MSAVTECAYTIFPNLFWLAYKKKVKYPEFCMGYNDETWCDGSGGHTRSAVTECAYLIPHLHICSDWQKRANIKSSVWTTVTKLSIVVVVGTSITHAMYLSSPNAHNKYLIWISVMTKKGKHQSTFFTFPQKRPTLYMYCEYSERISREPRNSCWCWIEEKRNKTKLWPFSRGKCFG